MLNFKNLFSFLSFFLSFFFPLLLRVIQVTNLQSQTKIVGTLKANTVFSLLVLSFSLPMLYCDSVTKSCTPTLRVREDTKVSEQFILRLQLDAVDFRYFVFSFPDAEFLHLSLMQSILGILYPVSRMQNFYIRLYAVDFRYFVKLSTSHMQNFCIKLDAVNFRHFVSSFPDAKFLHLSLMQ